MVTATRYACSQCGRDNRVVCRDCDGLGVVCVGRGPNESTRTCNDCDREGWSHWPDVCPHCDDDAGESWADACREMNVDSWRPWCETVGY